ncbi:MAG: helix-turn-helix domain-containing protein [bacterium]
MSSNIEIKKVCQYCGNEFTARTTTTKYCGDVCAKRAYKARKRNEKISKAKKETHQIKTKPIQELKEKEFLSITDTYQLLGVSRRTVYRMIKRGDLKATKIGGRTIIRKKDINQIFEQPEPQQFEESNHNNNLDDLHNLEYDLTINEAVSKYNISDKAFYEFRKRYKIPTKKNGKFTYIPSVLVEKYLNL